LCCNQNKHYNIDQNDEGALDDQGRDGGTNFILRIKEREMRLTLLVHADDDDDDDDDDVCVVLCDAQCGGTYHMPKRM
jgi:hypothetical protein